MYFTILFWWQNEFLKTITPVFSVISVLYYAAWVLKNLLLLILKTAVLLYIFVETGIHFLGFFEE